MRTSRRTAALLAVLALAAALRLPRLGRLPDGFIPDEALSAYDAFSILRTGRDQYGERLPLFPRSTARLSCLYLYATVPFVALLGLNETAARLPAALAGIATVAAVFAVVGEGYGLGAALLAAALLAVSPWHVLLSRTGFEWALLPLLVTLTLLLLSRAARGRGSWLAAGACAGLTFYSYAPGRLLMPLLLLAFAVVRRDAVRAQWRRALAAAAVTAILAAPVVASMAVGGLQRLESVRETADGEGAAGSFAARYLAAFNPSFVTRPARAAELHRLRSMGLMYPFELPLLALGLVRVLRDRSPVGLTLLCWLLAAPLCVAIHKDSPDPILTSTSLPAPQALAGIGGGWLLLVSGRLGRWRRPVTAVAAGAAAAFVGQMAHDLYTRYPAYSASAWSHGAREMVGRIDALRAPGDTVLVDGRWKLIYSLILFYTRYDPRARQLEIAGLEGRSERSRVGPYRIGDVSTVPSAPGRQLVWTELERGRRLFPGTAPAHVVRTPDGTAADALWVIQNDAQAAGGAARRGSS